MSNSENQKNSSKESFLELYIALCRALAQNRGEKYPALHLKLTEARALSGESLASMINNWHDQTDGIRESLKAMDENVLIGDAVPACMRALHINDLFNDTISSFSANSRKNIWPYLQGLATHAHAHADRNDLEEAPPSAFPFGEANEEHLKAFQQLANSIPPDLMQKMHTLAEGYQREISSGTKSIEDLNLSNVMTDVIGALSETNMQDIMSTLNVSSILAGLQSSAPELMKAMNSQMQQQQA
jgi:hypothetical protein